MYLTGMFISPYIMDLGSVIPGLYLPRWMVHVVALGGTGVSSRGILDVLSCLLETVAHSSQTQSCKSDLHSP